jgi:hypothetical protein
MANEIPTEQLAATWLLEHCTECSDGVITVRGEKQVCRDCNGSTRRRRGMFDARSGMDAPEHGVSPFYLLTPLMMKLERAAELARQVRDPANSQPLTELLDLIEELAA